MNIVQMVTIFKALMQGPASRLDLSERTGVPPKTVGKLLTELKKQKMIYVIDYSNESDGRNRVKLFTFGDGEDAQPRQSQPQAERSRRSYVKKVRAIEAANIRTTFVGGVSLWQ
jgi:DNA-binding IclR family transcriptional regulator